MGFEWDFEGGHFMRRAIDFVGIWRGAFYEVWVPVGFGGGGAFYEARYGFGWDFAYLPELTKYASTILHPRTYASR